MGGALGAAVAPWIPVGDAGMWALIGMAAMMGGTMRSPLTAMVFAVELTRDFNLFPALMTGCVAALGVTVLLMRRSILTEKLARRGHHITREYTIDPFEFARVQDVMDREVPTVSARLTLGEYTALIARDEGVLGKRQATLLLDDSGKLAGIITRGDVIRALQQEHADSMTVADAGSVDIVVTYPEEPLDAALTKMLQRDIGRLPVVDQTDPTQVVGYLGRAAILSARLRLHQEENVRQKG
jgi:CBS domain-containing protein